jgi:hypothetical protein
MLFDLLWSAGVEFLSLDCRNSSNKTLIVRHPDLLEWMVNYKAACCQSPTAHKEKDHEEK